MAAPTNAYKSTDIIYIYIFTYVHTHTYNYICLSVYLSVCLSVCLSVYLSLSLSLQLNAFRPSQKLMFPAPAGHRSPAHWRLLFVLEQTLCLEPGLKHLGVSMAMEIAQNGWFLLRKIIFSQSIIEISGLVKSASRSG